METNAMNEINKHLMKILFFIIVLSFFISCKKNKYSYIEKFYGNYDFKVIAQSRNQYLLLTYDTTYFLGNVKHYEAMDESKAILADKGHGKDFSDKISMEIMENTMVTMHIAEDGILYNNGNKIGNITLTSVKLNFHTGGGTYGTNWTVSGERQ